MTVYWVIYLPEVPYMHHINMVLANPTYIHRIFVWLWPTLHMRHEGVRMRCKRASTSPLNMAFLTCSRLLSTRFSKTLQFSFGTSSVACSCRELSQAIKCAMQSRRRISQGKSVGLAKIIYIIIYM